MDYQLKIQEVKPKSCAFTGHRDFCEERYLEQLDSAILKLIEDGVKTFYCGMAMGFDLACAEIVIKYKEKYAVKLIACIPCTDQEKSFPQDIKEKYRFAVEHSDESVVLAPSYYNGCMQARDRYMVENSDAVLCYLTKETGGTFYTVNYAKKLGKDIIIID